MAAPTSIPRVFAGWPETAIREAIRSIADHQHQILGHSRAGHARGLCCAQILAADDMQDRPQLTLRAGSYVRMVTSNLLPGSISDHLRGCATLAAPRLFHSVASRVSSTARLNTLAHKHSVHGLAYVPHHHRSFRNPSSFDGSKTIGKAFDEWTKTNFGRSQK